MGGSSDHPSEGKGSANGKGPAKGYASANGKDSDKGNDKGSGGKDAEGRIGEPISESQRSNIPCNMAYSATSNGIYAQPICISALAAIDPEDTITKLIQEAEDLQNSGDDSQIAELQSRLTHKHQLLQGALDSQKRTIAQLQEAISTMLSEQERMALMQAQLEYFSVQVESVLAQKQKEKEAAQLAQKQKQLQTILEMMQQNGVSVEDLKQILSMNTEKMNAAETSVAAEPSKSAEPAEKKLRIAETN